MKKMEIEGHKINVPSNWSDIRLSEYENWHMQKKETHLEYVQYVADVCKVDAKLLLGCPTTVFETLANAVQFVFDVDFVPKHSIEVEGEKYFIASSDKLTLGEWVDIDAVLTSDSDSKLSELLAIVCRPIDEKYDIELTAQRVEMYQDMPCDKILPLVSFFLSKDKRYRETLHHCLTVLMEANQFLRDTKTFAQSGDGIKQLPIWQRIKYWYLMRLLEKQLSKFSDSCSIE